MFFRKLRVYISGPYTKPDPGANVNRSCRVWDKLLRLGFAPYCPHWNMIQHAILPRPYEDWINFDLEWVSACDIVLRIAGVSAGADRECAHAEAEGIPVVYSIEELRVLVENQWPQLKFSWE